MKHRIKVAVVFGTRPEAIKLAPVVLELSKDKRFQAVTIVTGQHREMLDQVLNLFHISPDYDLGVMTEKQSLARSYLVQLIVWIRFSGRFRPMPYWCKEILLRLLLLLSRRFTIAFHVGHVEAGLRTEDRWQPFPEEINRRLTSVLADWHFARPSLRDATC